MRKFLFPIVVIIATIIIVARLLYLQLIDDSFLKKADINALKIVYEYPERGYIYDRNGQLLVANQPSYDIMVIPNEIKNIDINEICTILDITTEEYHKKIEKAKVYSPRLPSVFLAQLSKIEFAAFQEKIRHFKGFYIQKRNLRDYQVDFGANVFGYIRQINEMELQKRPYYKSGELIGMRGVEQAYEEDLRGIRGVHYILKDKFNKEIGTYKDGIYDTIAVKGNDITITIDKELQKYGEELMIRKRGGIVAIEPKTGEILALITAPSYDPSLLVGRDRSKNYVKIDSIPGKPFFDKVLQGQFPPGSPFKILTGLIGLQEEVIDTNTGFTCHHGFYLGGRFIKCHDSGTWNLHPAIAKSCNTYFSQTYMRIINKYATPSQGVDAWHDHLKSFGLGQYMGYDLPSGQKGRIPDSDLYNKVYKGWNWKSATIVSNSIGQGEVEMTPIQLANVMCAVANEGYFYTPHIIKKIENKTIDKSFVQKKQTTIDKQHFRPVIEGLHEVYLSGTASRLQIPDINICGKTGTVENFATVDGEKVKLQDHSVFLAFAPKENPKIVIAVFIENGGFGATWAGPIASLMIEKYLKGEITRTDLEKRMLEGDLSANYISKDISDKQKEEKERLRLLEKQRQLKLKAKQNGKN
ncbi:penicillin-binding protein 2 [Myroides sp. JBRI-B21084]|uniref:penicillin-binding protein 2 n=1 Tax=Myroides sp. JBRI-B21084 TaxID=3119977 RepID=UPI0026E116A0|nr:penicillin-binding protein 2 [Paenimyroides cloacae]WKW47414.1 penicillin-binding protein 2 [Paenimyroides cloacae]